MIKKKTSNSLWYKEINKRPTGIEPVSQAWKAWVIAVIRQAHELWVYNTKC